MKNNHIAQGLVFVAATALIGAGAFAWSQIGSDDQPPTSNFAQSETAVPSDFEMSKIGGHCSDTETLIDITIQGGRGGALEVLSPLDNTDALSAHVFEVADGFACIPFATLATMLDRAGNKTGSIDLALTYDPAGSISNVRSKLDYMPDYISGETSWSQPPKELKFGTGVWSSIGQVAALQVRWMTKTELRELIATDVTDDVIDEQIGSDLTYQECMDSSGGVTVAMLDCAANELEDQDAKLNVVYQQKMRGLSGSAKSELRFLQRAWIDERDRTCSVQAAIEEGGTLASVNYSACLVSETTERVDWLSQY